MGLQQSNLNQTDYGYDTVVAISQRALNAAIRAFYQRTATDGTFKETVLYFGEDLSGQPFLITDPIAEFGDFEPWGIPSWKGMENMPDDMAMFLNRIYFGFKFTPGDPSKEGALDVNYVALNPATQNINYSLLCESIQVVFYESATEEWVNSTQSVSSEFNINADVQLLTVLDSTNLPTIVQTQISNMSNISVAQLTLDLDSAVVSPTSSITGLVPSYSVFLPLMTAFSQAYFNTYKNTEGPVLNYSIINNAVTQPTLQPTSMQFCIDEYIATDGSALTKAEMNLRTLNYQYAVCGNKLAAPAQLNWNWLDDPASDGATFNGAISISRKAFAEYLKNQLTTYVASNCFTADVVCEEISGGDVFLASFLADYDLSNLAEPFQPFLASQSNGDLMLSFAHSSPASAIGKACTEDYMNATTSFLLTVTIEGANLIIYQELKLDIDSVINKTQYSGTPINKTYTDYFEPVIQDNGILSFQNIPAKSQQTDTSVAINFPGEEGGWLSSYIAGIPAASFQQVPVDMSQQFVFPGGSAVTYKNAQFSAFSDLACNITYTTAQA